MHGWSASRGWRCGGFETGSGEIELVDHALVAHDVEVPGFIGGESGDGLRAVSNLKNAFQQPILLLEGPNSFGDVVAENIKAIEG